MVLRDINLIPTEVLHKKQYFRCLGFWSGCLTLSLLLILGFYLYQVYVVLPKERPRTTIEDIHKRLGTTIEDIKETQQEIERLSLQESFIEKLSRIESFSKLLLKLSKIMNVQTWLTKLTIDAGTEKEGVVPGIKLYGYSLSNNDLGNFLTQLSDEPLFKGVELKYAKESQIKKTRLNPNIRLNAIQFQIEFKILRSSS